MRRGSGEGHRRETVFEREKWAAQEEVRLQQIEERRQQQQQQQQQQQPHSVSARDRSMSEASTGTQSTGAASGSPIAMRPVAGSMDATSGELMVASSYVAKDFDRMQAYMLPPLQTQQVGRC